MIDADLATVRDAHRDLFAHYNGLCERLSDEQMAVQSLCPDWSVRAVITHAIGIEDVLSGWEPSDTTPPPFKRLGAWEQRTSGLDRAAFAAAVAEVTDARLQELAAMPPEVMERPSFTPSGLATYGRFLQVRLFDLWVHARDIALPLGESTDDRGFAAEAALTEVDDSIGYIVGKKIGLPSQKSIVFRVIGSHPRAIAVAVNGRATRVEPPADPDVEVTADLETFVLLAAGRIDPQRCIDDGRITWRGDAHWGEVAARNLAYTV